MSDPNPNSGGNSSDAKEDDVEANLAARDQKYVLGPNYTAAACYSHEWADGQLQGILYQGRLMAELTIPSVMPPQGYKAGMHLPGNNQSVGAKAVNSLSSVLMFMAFPPGQPIMRFSPKTYDLQAQINQDPELYAHVLLALSELEMAHREDLQATPIATAYVGYIKTLLVVGNTLWRHIKLDKPSYHRPDSYIVRRGEGGEPLVTVLKREVTLDTLSADHQEEAREALHWADSEMADKRPWECKVDIYDVMRLHTDDKGDQSWCYWQEVCNGVMLQGTEVECDMDNPPLWPGWLIPNYGSNWGGSYCGEYVGDFFSLEAQSSGFNDIVALAALALTFVKPGGTSIKQVREARNLSILPGKAEDVTVFRSDKAQDGNFVSQSVEMITKRIEAAFLMQESIQRQGERVTAEEIQRLGSALDKAMGGLYTFVAQGHQRVIITRAVHLNEEANPKIPPLPQNVVAIKVITGIDAMGQSTDATNLMQYAAAARQAFPTTFETSHNPNDFFTRLAAAMAVKPDGLVLSTQEIAQKQQALQSQQAQQTLISKGAGPAVKGMMDSMANQPQGGGQNPLQPPQGADPTQPPAAPPQQ